MRPDNTAPYDMFRWTVSSFNNQGRIDGTMFDYSTSVNLSTYCAQIQNDMIIDEPWGSASDDGQQWRLARFIFPGNDQTLSNGGREIGWNMGSDPLVILQPREDGPSHYIVCYNPNSQSSYDNAAVLSTVLANRVWSELEERLDGTWHTVTIVPPGTVVRASKRGSGRGLGNEITVGGERV